MPLTKIENDALGNTVTGNIASLTIGANVSINTSAVFVGNSTVNTVMTASGISIANTFGTSSNTTNLLENRGGQLFFNGRRVRNINPYAAVYGYALGGYIGGYVATTDRITLSTSATAASTVSNLSSSRYFPAGVSDATIYGYTCGGETTGGGVSAVSDRTTFSTSVTAASTVSNLSQAREDPAGISDGAAYGYILGGSTTGVGAAVTTTDRITFSTSGTAASTASNLSQARYEATGISDGSVYGYAVGGNTGATVATADRMTFSTSVTAANTASNLSGVRRSSAGVSDGAVYGYALGGWTTAAVSTSDRLTFSTSVTAASTVSNLSLSRMQGAGVSDGAVYGYVMGGTTGSSATTTTDRITFSTSVTAASTVSNLSAARYGLAGLSDGAV